MTDDMKMCESLIAALGAGAKGTVVSHVSGGSFAADGTVWNGLPDFTRVEYTAKPGKRSYIRNEIWLPDAEKWNGRFVGLGNGGMAGSIRYDRLTVFLRAGYACANSDLGTSAGKFCGVGNPDVYADFGWRATHIMTEDAKALIRVRYGRDAEFSYFYGASTGGQQAFSEAERFPEDYDGICAGVPAFNRVSLHIYFIWNYRKLHTSDGCSLFTDNQIAEISALAPVYFRDHGGAYEGDAFVSYPWHGDRTPEEFVAFVSSHVSWMTDEKAEALRAVYSGPSDPLTGERIYCGMPIGAELNSGGMLTFSRPGCPNSYPFLWVFGRDYSLYDFDFSSDADKARRVLSQDMDANDDDLSAFAARGGKLLTFSGSADPWVPYPESFAFCERAAAGAGGAEKLLSFFRCFLIPGRAHSGGIGAEEIYPENRSDRSLGAFDALTEWVEKGKAPDRLTAVSTENPSVAGKRPFERPVYPYGSAEFPFCPHPAGSDERFRLKPSEDSNT